MTTVYLDVDDEITSAASRMRSSEESRVVLVLPAGSRLGTSRINFRLLAREAASNGRSLSIVSPEAATRALAASAGLPVFASVFEQEAAAGAGTEGPPVGTAAGAATAIGGLGGPAGAPAAGGAGVAPGGLEPADRPPLPSESTAVGEQASPAPVAVAADPSSIRARPLPGDAATAPERGVPSAPDARPSAPRPAGRRAAGPIVVGLVALALAVVVIGVLGYLFLPSATVTVVVRPRPLGPLDMTVTADPAVTVPDPATGVVPAQRPTFDLASSGTYPATGKKVTETQATGSVRWQNCDPTSAYQVPQGTVVRTRGGIAFATDEAVFLPVAVLAGNPPAITCQSRDVGVTATVPGESGNVPAGAIAAVPPAYNSVVVRVTNPAPTTGGTHTETKLISQKDVDAAKKALSAKLDAEFAAILADPTKVPAGGQAFPDTAERSTPAFQPDPAGLVGQEVDGFDLAATATGSVTVVDETSVTRMAEAALLASVPAGDRLVPGSTSVDLGEPTVQGQAVRYPVTASAKVVTPLDPADVRAAVAGKPVAQAQQAIAGYGDATISVWPSWVTAVPTYDFRLDVQVVTEGAGGGSSPGPSATGGAGSPSAGATASAAP
jgi:hypothetical protein